jgi:hypothetical protein
MRVTWTVSRIGCILAISLWGKLTICPTGWGEGDILYISFGRSEHVTGVELADNILLRLDTGKATGAAPRAVGLTFISFARMLARHRDQPFSVALTDLRGLPEDLWQAVLEVTTTAPVSDFLTVGLAMALPFPAVPEQIADSLGRLNVVQNTRTIQQALP